MDKGHAITNSWFAQTELLWHTLCKTLVSLSPIEAIRYLKAKESRKDGIKYS
jgi:hypothetical protein